MWYTSFAIWNELIKRQQTSVYTAFYSRDASSVPKEAFCLCERTSILWALLFVWSPAAWPKETEGSGDENGPQEDWLAPTIALHAFTLHVRDKKNWVRAHSFGLFRLFSFPFTNNRIHGIPIPKRTHLPNWSQKYTITLYSEYSYSGIAPKERALS